VTSRRVVRVVGLFVWVGAGSRGAGVEILGPEPPSVAQAEWLAHRDAPVASSLVGDSGAPIPLAARAGGPCRTVFGYLPYWESAANIRWDLLTHLACFSVEVRGDGTIGNTRGWPWTSTINTAHAHGVKVILVATLFDPAAIETLISSPIYTQAFLANIKAKMLQGQADGLNIDFEGSGAAWKSKVNAFMAQLTAYLHAEIPGCEVTFAGPAVNWRNEWDLAGLAASCDGIFIMGYAFAGSWSKNTGPNSPLTGGSINITNTITVQYAPVTQQHPEKLILGVPYYGGHWKTVSDQPRAAVTAWVGSTRFRDDEPNSRIYGVLWDTVSQTPWYRWFDGLDWHQVWYDNARSLGLKYALAEQYNLAGVGMWALNYDGARPELWDELDRHFGAGCDVPADLDDDHDVDVTDFGLFQACYNGPGLPPAYGGCLAADFDGDGDVDVADFAAFQACFNGVDVIPACR